MRGILITDIVSIGSSASSAISSPVSTHFTQIPHRALTERVMVWIRAFSASSGAGRCCCCWAAAAGCSQRKTPSTMWIMAVYNTTGSGGDMSVFNLKVNGRSHSVDVDPTTPLLYVLSDDLALRGPKLGCGLGQ